MSAPLPAREDVEQLPTEELALRLLDNLVGSVAQARDAVPPRDQYVREATIRAATDALRAAGAGGTIRMSSTDARERLPEYQRALTEAWNLLVSKELLVERTGQNTLVSRDGLLIVARHRREGRVPPGLDMARWGEAQQESRQPAGVGIPAEDTTVELLDTARLGELGSSEAETKAPTAFVSWAHSGRETPTEVAQAWAERVYEFALALIANGIETTLDLFRADDATVNWQTFGPQAIQDSDFVFLVVSKEWAERYEGTNDPTEGAGAAREAASLKGVYDKNQDVAQRRFKIVLLADEELDVVPNELVGLSRFRVRTGTADDRGVTDIVRMVTGQASYPKPDLGPVPVLEPVMSPVTKASDDGEEAIERRVALEVERVDLERRVGSMSGGLKSFPHEPNPHNYSLPWNRARAQAEAEQWAAYDRLQEVKKELRSLKGTS
jgi:hypothetical protein